MEKINHRASTDIDAYVGRRIKQRREELGFSQENLAESLGISFQQVQKYERGANRVGASRLYHIANALDVETSFFFSGLENQDAKKDNEIAYLLSNEKSIPLLRIFVKSSNAIQSKILELAQLMRA